MTTAAPRAWVYAIANPYNGPDTQAFCPVKVYSDAMSALKSAGGHVLGYVPSGYAGMRMIPGDTTSCTASGSGGAFTSQDIVNCAEKYDRFYGSNIEGIFIDEMGRPDTCDTAGTPNIVAFYKAVYDGIKARHPAWTIIGNPGCGISEQYFTAADIIVTFENMASAYPPPTMPTYQSRRSSLQLSTIVYSGSMSGFSTFLSQTRARNLSYVYYSDQSVFSALPTNWFAEVDAVAAVNGPGNR